MNIFLEYIINFDYLLYSSIMEDDVNIVKRIVEKKMNYEITFLER